MKTLTISKTVLRRFILGRQGLWPGRRWMGKAGTAQALCAAEAVQLDPLTIVARSHDIVLWGRVIDYQPDYLLQLMYEDRQFFDYGGGLFVYPMTELPYWQLSMQHRARQPRLAAFLAQNEALLEQVRAELRSRGPLGNRDLVGNRHVESYRARKDTGLALYNLWLTGELMTHGRRNFERRYHFRQEIAPPEFNYVAPVAEAEDYFARKVLAFAGMTTPRKWRSSWQGYLERWVSPAEAREVLAAMEARGDITAVMVEGNKEPFYLLTSDLPLLAELLDDMIPSAWQPLDTTTLEEVVFLSPLEIVSARGRADWLFGFEYLWEIYKPASSRRWGAYTLPILYGDRLVARLDPKLDRRTGVLLINGFWPEEAAIIQDPAFCRALARGLVRFMRFLGAKRLASATDEPLALPVTVEQLVYDAIGDQDQARPGKQSG